MDDYNNIQSNKSEKRRDFMKSAAVGAAGVGIAAAVLGGGGSRLASSLKNSGVGETIGNAARGAKKHAKGFASNFKEGFQRGYGATSGGVSTRGVVNVSPTKQIGAPTPLLSAPSPGGPTPRGNQQTMPWMDRVPIAGSGPVAGQSQGRRRPGGALSDRQLTHTGAGDSASAAVAQRRAEQLTMLQDEQLSMLNN